MVGLSTLTINNSVAGLSMVPQNHIKIARQMEHQSQTKNTTELAEWAWLAIYFKAEGW